MSAVPQQSLFQQRPVKARTVRYKKADHMHTELEKAGLASSLFGLFILLSLISACIWLGYHLLRPETLPIKQVNISGEFRHLSPSRLKSLVTDSVQGGFFNINVTRVRNQLMQAPWVENVDVSRVWPDTLKVDVTERVAVARWGDDALLNAKAEHFMPPAATIPFDLPLLIGPEESYKLVLERFNELNSQLSKAGLYAVQLELNERRAWSFKVQKGFSVVIGRSDYQQRVNRFIRVVVHAMANRIDEIEEIDMRYTNGFAVRWKNQDKAQQMGQM